MRIGMLGFIHESNTFVSFPTTRQGFEGGLHRRREVLSRWKDTRHELGGFMAGADVHGFEAVPLMTASATPGGPLTAYAFESILGEMLQLLEEERGLDGLLLALHGAMAAEDHRDADGEIVSRIREVFDGEKPVIMTLDCHANISKKMVDNVTATVLYRTNPHTDQRERGLEAAGLMARTVRGRIHPVQALEKPPMVINITKQYTRRQPALGLIRDAEQVMRRTAILSASVGLGFAFADVKKMGASFLAVADGDEEVARRQARWMAVRAWNRRDEFVGILPSPVEAVNQAARSPDRPVVLMDVGDNVGGGGPADSTILLAECIRQGVSDVLIVLRDREAVERCVEAGVGAELSLEVGGKTDDLHGHPVPVHGRVRTLSDGRFVDDGPRHGGGRFYDQGVTAVVETPERHTIVLTSLRMPPFSLEQVLSLGVKPETKRIIVVKGVIAPRAAYEPIAEEIITVDTPGSTSANLLQFEYQHRRRPLFPFEVEATFPQTYAKNRWLKANRT